MWLKHTIEASYNLDDLLCGLFFIPIIILFDIVMILFQPIFYIAYKKWVKENSYEFK